MRTNVTTKTIRQAKGVRQIACLTAYDALTARLADMGGVDLILVGDSVGNTVLGFESSVHVTLEMMEHHTAAAARARPAALLVADVPFCVAHEDVPSVLRSCARLIRAGARAVKVEGGVKLAPVVGALVEAGIPVCGHVGLQPQQVHRLGGYRKFGDAEAESVLADARAMEAAGAFAIVGEMLGKGLAARLRDALSVPLIGIGSGVDCDGQVLVIHDLLGLTETPPPFAKPRVDLAASAVGAIAGWVADVRALPNSAPTSSPATPKAEISTHIPL
ncbi:MAG: 3-methyl-2-oxobutanoate hydroxymethyltransferase [Puniceicoccales bacterium]|jgi:3-methyl-2-oxobutanoate hydroxymethyltransferase|nr:3-methyl-2-oxobutanoate hydroxymethyltransferase [Puniceicoccales bacterium]